MQKVKRKKNRRLTRRTFILSLEYFDEVIFIDFQSMAERRGSWPQLRISLDIPSIFTGEFLVFGRLRFNVMNMSVKTQMKLSTERYSVSIFTLCIVPHAYKSTPLMICRLNLFLSSSVYFKTQY